MQQEVERKTLENSLAFCDDRLALFDAVAYTLEEIKPGKFCDILAFVEGIAYTRRS